MKETHFLSPEEVGAGSGSEMESFVSKLKITVDELENLCEGDEGLEMLLEDVLNMSLRYTETVLDMTNELRKTENGVKTEGYREISENRGRIHDTTIESINILARALKKAGKDIKWVEGFNNDRAAYGKFAILITLSRIRKTV